MNNLNTAWFKKLPLTDITSVKPVSGGDINLAYQIITSDRKKFFIKIQPKHKQDYFKHEISGLKTIGKIINTPTPLYHGEIDDNAYLILNWLDETWGNQADLGYAVAKMHQHYHDKFGFMENHQTKALIKNNSWNSDWVDFYVNQRLEPEVTVASERGRWNKWRQAHYSQMVKQFSNFYRQHEVKPSLLHGDLWAGNFLFAGNHEPFLIDPDAVYGDREFDLAMTTVFGGFDNSFYHAYSQIFPFDDQLDERLSWYRFYYLCMHLILFGESYGGAVDRILSQY